MEKLDETKTYEWVKESMRRANAKYREANREAFNARQKKFYDLHKNDEVYKERLKAKARAYYQKKKIQKLTEAETDKMEIL